MTIPKKRLSVEMILDDTPQQIAKDSLSRGPRVLATILPKNETAIMAMVKRWGFSDSFIPFYGNLGLIAIHITICIYIYIYICMYIYMYVYI